MHKLIWGLCSICTEDMLCMTIHIIASYLLSVSLNCHLDIIMYTNLNLAAVMRKWVLPYADSVAPDQPAHPRSLIWELHCPLFYRLGSHWLTSGQCSSQIRLRGCAGWSGATLAAYVRRPIFAWRGSNTVLKPYHIRLSYYSCTHLRRGRIPL